MGDLFAVAAWHADKAMLAYHAGDMDAFVRHIMISDRIRRQAYALRRAA